MREFASKERPTARWAAGLFQYSGILGIAPIRLTCDTLKLPRRLLDLHEVPGALVTLLVHAVGSFKLGATGNRAATEAVASILSHELSSLSRAAAKQARTYHCDRRNTEVSP